MLHWLVHQGKKQNVRENVINLEAVKNGREKREEMGYDDMYKSMNEVRNRVAFMRNDIIDNIARTSAKAPWRVFTRNLLK